MIAERAVLLARLAASMNALVERYGWPAGVDLPPDAMMPDAGTFVEIYCASPLHPGREVHVLNVITEGLWAMSGAARLIDDAEVPTIAAELLAGGGGRSRFRLECPECGDHGPTPEFRAEKLLPKLARMRALGVPRVDLYALQRYASG